LLYFSLVKTFAIVVTVFLTTLCATDAAGGGIWDKCKTCHNGSMAPDAMALKKKYKTADDMIRAAKESKSIMMKKYKGDAELREAAQYLGLK
jgi:hypothetical protein